VKNLLHLSTSRKSCIPFKEDGTGNNKLSRERRKYLRERSMVLYVAKGIVPLIASSKPQDTTMRQPDACKERNMAATHV
jgi:hypothetical protein